MHDAGHQSVGTGAHAHGLDGKPQRVDANHRRMTASAGEVRALGQRGRSAARKIKALIGSSVEQVETDRRLVRDAGATMGEIVSSCTVSAGLSEIGDNVGQ